MKKRKRDGGVQIIFQSDKALLPAESSQTWLKTEIIIGKKSNNDPVVLYMEELPHLFVSWSEQDQMETFYTELSDQLLVKLNAGFIELAFCCSSKVISAASRRRKPLFQSLIRDAETGLTGNRMDFLRKLRRELSKRQKLKDAKQPTPSPYLKPLIVLVDDLIDLVVTRNKKTGLLFLELMRQGPADRIHFIIGTTRSYRGLVRQLVQFEKEGEPSVLDNYLPELILSPEGLFFYKRPEELNYTRLFAIKEGLK